MRCLRLSITTMDRMQQLCGVLHSTTRKPPGTAYIHFDPQTRDVYHRTAYAYRNRYIGVKQQTLCE
jgi:hypothetical protein